MHRRGGDRSHSKEYLADENLQESKSGTIARNATTLWRLQLRGVEAGMLNETLRFGVSYFIVLDQQVIVWAT